MVGQHQRAKRFSRTIRRLLVGVALGVLSQALAHNPVSGARLAGQVLWGHYPLPNVRVELVQLAEVAHEVVVRTTLTGPEGTFAFNRVPPGQYWVRAVAPSDAFLSTARSVTVTEPATRELRLQMQQRLVLTSVPGTGRLCWLPVAEAVRYRVEVIAVAAGNRRPVLQQEAMTTCFTPELGAAPGEALWGVAMALGDDGLVLATSPYLRLDGGLP